VNTLKYRIIFNFDVELKKDSELNNGCLEDVSRMFGNFLRLETLTWWHKFWWDHIRYFRASKYWIVRKVRADFEGKLKRKRFKFYLPKIGTPPIKNRQSVRNFPDNLTTLEYMDLVSRTWHFFILCGCIIIIVIKIAMSLSNC